MTTVASVHPNPHDVTLDEVWQRATKREAQRLVLTMVLAGVLIFVIGLMDLTTWPPRWEPSDSWGIAAVMAGVFLALMLGVSVRQKISSRERYVSPLLGLEADERRTAKEHLHTAHPSEDPRLRDVEIAQARQRALFGPSSLVVALLPAGVQAMVAVIILGSGSPVLGVLFALSVMVNGWSAWKNYRDTQDAHRFLDALEGQRP